MGFSGSHFARGGLQENEPREREQEETPHLQPKTHLERGLDPLLDPRLAVGNASRDPVLDLVLHRVLDLAILLRRESSHPRGNLARDASRLGAHKLLDLLVHARLDRVVEAACPLDSLGRARLIGLRLPRWGRHRAWRAPHCGGIIRCGGREALAVPLVEFLVVLVGRVLPAALSGAKVEVVDVARGGAARLPVGGQERLLIRVGEASVAARTIPSLFPLPPSPAFLSSFPWPSI